jgi:hypothetical protein
LNLPSSLNEPLIKSNDNRGVGLDELDLPDSPANDAEPAAEEEMDDAEVDEAAPAEPSDAAPAEDNSADEKPVDETPAESDVSPAAQDSP